MTYPDDFMLFHFGGVVGDLRYRCKDVGVEWPPPEDFSAGPFKFKLENFSQITDEDRSKMTHVVRGAEYKLVEGGDIL